MAEVALRTGILSEAGRVKPAVVNHQRAFARGLILAILLSIPAWAAIAALVILLA
jgi:hypothetical protein